MKLSVKGHTISGSIDGRKLAEAEHQGPVKGMGVLASSYNLNYFDNVVVE